MNKPKLKLAWLYYDLLELYGDRGNIKAIEYLCDKSGIEITIDKITLNDDIDISGHDILFLGGGTDYAQSLLYKDLLERKPQIEKFLKNKGFALTICGGYQMFGKYYVAADGTKIEGLSIFDHYTEAGSERCIGNVIINSNLDGNEFTLVGFENHGGQTKNVKNPLGKTIVGHGNETNAKYEGCLEPGFIGTYLHGPLLPKNPEITKYILEYVYKNKYDIDVDIKIDQLILSKKAKEIVINKES